MNKTLMLRELLYSEKLSFFMEAHSAISAKIAAECGFKAIWASGLSISASMGLSDRNEASWTQVLDIIEFMVECTEVPILMDGDTGFGNFNNVQRLVKKLCQKGVSGVCLEDKVFPKLNSFLGNNQILAEIPEFVGKIKAAKDSQLDSNFCVVARIEALVSGKEMEEALIRAQYFYEAGADAILIHSKKDNADEIIKFMELWAKQCPVVIIPTKYYQTPTSVFRDIGVSAVIWANHNLRASIAAMRRITKIIKQEESTLSVEKEIASLDDIFSLTNEFEVQKAEKKYSYVIEPLL
jgi:phosphoenolpyruvate phosphomutase